MAAVSAHSYHDGGDPRLVCSVPWAISQLSTLEPDHTLVVGAQEALASSELAISVRWGGLARDSRTRVELQVFELGVGGEAVSGACAVQGDPCEVRFRPRAPGAMYVAKLAPCAAEPEWSRALHVIAPFPPAWRNASATCFTSARARLTPSREEVLALAAPLDGGDAIGAPCDRGLGLELELLSVPPDPGEGGDGHFSKQSELLALIEHAAATAEDAGALALAALIRRVARWQVALDPACVPFISQSARALVPEMLAAGARDEADALALLTERSRSIPSEFKSALPPHELSFAQPESPTPHEATVGLRLLMRLGVAAPTISQDGCECNTALHVHVNARNPLARGRLLSAREILAVWLAWVRFDFVTVRFARSWCWCDRWAAPLYATGPEFTFNERPHERGHTPPNAQRAAAYDVPAFFAHAHASAERLDLATEDERVAHMFGRRDQPPTGLGKYCGLNVLPLAVYGTLEFRRQHASTDEAFILRWAHFCCSFVETFGADDAFLARYIGVPMHEGLARLEEDQRRATLPELMSFLDGRVHADTPAFFLARGCGPHVASRPAP